MIEKNVIPQIVDLGREACYELLEAVGFGHLGFSADDRPYVVPIHFAVEEPFVYFFTTEGKKTEIIDQNPNVCLQVERVADSHNWESVIVEGTAVILDEEADKEKAMALILAKNPTLTPAFSHPLDGFLGPRKHLGRISDRPRNHLRPANDPTRAENLNPFAVDLGVIIAPCP
jgi:nitroimidazol reductase NimA-like FMN-containing flavoprotein (pyridoxamine 5'-phosphate oxidase superfamily)